MYICRVTYYKNGKLSDIGHQTNTGHCCPLKQGNTQPAFTFGLQWQGFKIDYGKYQEFNMKSMDFTISGVKSANKLKKSKDLCGFHNKILWISRYNIEDLVQYFKWIWTLSK